MEKSFDWSRKGVLALLLEWCQSFFKVYHHLFLANANLLDLKQTYSQPMHLTHELILCMLYKLCIGSVFSEHSTGTNML